MKHPFFIALAALIATSLICRPLQSRIYKKSNPDGSIDFYNYEETVTLSDKHVFPDKFDDLITKYAALEKLDPYLIKCIIKVESNFQPGAVSVAGAMGLMQIMPDLATYFHIKDPFNPDDNLYAGTRHFRYLMNYFGNDIPLSLAAYHAGLSRVKKNMSIPPIKTTIAYVNRIMQLYTGKATGAEYTDKISRLYQKIEKDGTILIFSK